MSCARISDIGRFRSTGTTSPPRCRRWSRADICAGSVSSCSRNTPSGVIFARTCRSALHDTPMPTGRLAPCRGSRITRTSWQKYLPPNCAPMPMLREISSTCCSNSRSRNAWPALLPRGRQRVEPLRSTRASPSSASSPPTGAADHDRQMVRRAGRGAQRLDLRLEELRQLLRRQDRRGFPGTETTCWRNRRPWRRTSGETRRRGARRGRP